MPRKWLLVGLVVLLLVLLVAAGVGWWWLGQFSQPYLVETAPYRLSESWYIGEFQPIFLGKLMKDENTAFRIAYRGPSGLLKLGIIIVGVQGGKEAIAPLEMKEALRLGQRIRVQYLLYTTNPGEAELDAYCLVSPRLCQVAKVVRATQQPEEVRVVGGKEPQFPVLVTEISSQLKAWGKN